MGTQKGANLCLKCTKIRLAAGLRPNPLGSLSAPPHPLAAIKGVLTLLLQREERGGKRRLEWDGREGRKKEGEGKGCVVTQARTTIHKQQGLAQA